MLYIYQRQTTFRHTLLFVTSGQRTHQEVIDFYSLTLLFSAETYEAKELPASVLKEEQRLQPVERGHTKIPEVSRTD